MLVGPFQQIPELLLFQSDILVPGSEKFHLKSAFGFGEFKNIFTAKFNYKGTETTVFISLSESKNKAKGLVKSYTRFLMKEGAH